MAEVNASLALQEKSQRHMSFDCFLIDLISYLACWMGKK